MHLPKKIILITMVLMLGTSLLMGGCNTAKKPYTPNPQSSKKTNITTPTNNATQVANRCAAEANKVSGVKKATAFVAGKTVYIGLDLNANLEKNKSKQVENAVLNRLKKLEPGYTILVTSDIDIVTRIKKVAQGIAQGKPISSFSQEIQDIGTRINPKVKRTNL